MESRIQFRIENETKLLAQKAAEAKGATLSEACRRLAQQMADEQGAAEEHENWLKDKVDAAFARLHEGEAVYLTQRQAEERMSNFKANLNFFIHSIHWPWNRLMMRLNLPLSRC